MIVISSGIHSANAYKVPTMCWVLGTKDTTECNEVLELTVLCENKTIKIFPVLEKKFLHFYYNSWLYYKVSIMGSQGFFHRGLDIIASRTCGCLLQTSALLQLSNPLPHTPCIWAVGITLAPRDWMTNLANMESQGN